MKKTLAALLLLLTLAPAALGEGDASFPCVRSGWSGWVVLPLENGDALTTCGEDCVRRVTPEGETVWTAEFGKALSQWRAPVTTADGDFIIAGVDLASGLDYAARIDGRTGETQLTPFAEGVVPLAVAENGCLVSIPDGEGRSELVFAAWDGTVRSHALSDCEWFLPQQCEARDGRIALCAGARHGQWQGGASVLLCWDEAQGLRFLYEVGTVADALYLNAVCLNALGGATLIASENDTARMRLVELDAEGAVRRQIGLAGDRYGPTVDILEQDAAGNYVLWGKADNPNAAGGYAADIPFRIEIDGRGDIVSERHAVVCGTCARYRNGEIYIVQRVDEREVYMPFTAYASEERHFSVDEVSERF